MQYNFLINFPLSADDLLFYTRDVNQLRNSPVNENNFNLYDVESNLNIEQTEFINYFKFKPNDEIVLAILTGTVGTGKVMFWAV